MLKGLGGLGDMAKMMKKAQEMQGKMAQIQDELEQVEVHGEAGAGLVKISANAKGEVKLLDIDPNKFEFFLFIELLLGIKFSSLSLKTVANFNSRYLSNCFDLSGKFISF